MPSLLLTAWDAIKSSGIGILVAAGLGMFAIIGGLSILSQNYTLGGIKSRTVGDGQHGTARWATSKEIRKSYAHVPFTVSDWRKGQNLPTEQGLVLGCKGKKTDSLGGLRRYPLPYDCGLGCRQDRLLPIPQP